MLFKIKSIALVSLVLLFVSVSAKSESYGGISYQYGSYDEGGFGSANLGGLSVEVGTYIFERLSVEGNLLMGIQGANVDYMGTNYHLTLESSFSLFLRGDVPIDNDNRAYILMGHTSGGVEAKINYEYTFETRTGFSYGIGFERDITPDMSLKMEYVSYLDDDIFSYKGLNIGFGFRL